MNKMGFGFNPRHGLFARIFRRMLVLGMSIAGLCISIPVAVQADGSVTEDLLDVLKENNQISQEQYDELAKRATQEKERDWQVYWKNGTHIKSADGDHKLKFGGRIMLDWAVIDADNPTNEQLEAEEGDEVLSGNGVEFRRTRIFFQGTVYNNIDFKAQYDFAGSDADFKDVYIGLRNIPAIGHLRFGHMKEPLSLEEITSSKYVTFMERSLPVTVFAPSRNTGVMIFNNALEKRLMWAAGVFYDTDDTGDQFRSNTRVNATARVTGLPIYQEDGRHLLHVGLGYTNKLRDEDEDTLRFRTRPESHITDVRTVNTGRVPSDGADIFNVEAAYVLGSFSLQGEFFQNSLSSGAAGDPIYTGAYLFGSWFLTGEHRKYKAGSASFDRVRPYNNFSFSDAGWGALELALRWSYVDLTDETVSGGEQTDITAGLNWYLTPNARFMFNYIHGDVENRQGIEDGELNIFQSRFQIDF